MIVKELTNANNEELSKIEYYVSNHPGKNFFQSTFAYKLYKQVENHDPCLLYVEKNGKIIGSLNAVFLKEPGVVKGFFSKRCIVEGGPLILEDENILEVLDLLLHKLNQIASSKSIYTEFRNSFDTKHMQENFAKNGWVFEEHLNILVDLTKDQEELWSNVSSKRRNEIRRAKLEGSEFKVFNTKEALLKSYEIIEEVYKRVGIPYPPRTFFEKAFEILGTDHFKVFNAVYKDKIIGTMLTLCYKDTIYDWYAGSFKDYYDKYPNDLIPWEVFLWGKMAGYKEFDFGGAGKPNVPYGVRKYKKRFGGKFVNYGRYKRINNELLYKIGEIGLKFLKK